MKENRRTREAMTITRADVAVVNASELLERARTANPENTVIEEDGKIIVAASAQLSGAGVLGPRSSLAQRLETAMSEAVLLALAHGHSINDAMTIRAYKDRARAAVLAGG